VFGTRLEVLVHVNVFAFVVSDFFEAVHVELPDEGSKITMFEINRKNILSEACDTLDGEGITSRCPRNDVRVAVILNRG